MQTHGNLMEGTEPGRRTSAFKQQFDVLISYQ